MNNIDEYTLCSEYSRDGKKIDDVILEYVLFKIQYIGDRYDGDK